MRNIKVVAFDCDGVLFDTVKANQAYYNHILHQFGKPNMTPEQFAYAHMHTVDESLGYLFKDAENLNAAREYRKKMGYARFISYMEIEPNLKRLLNHLRPKYATAIATNRSDTMQIVLETHHLVEHFDLVVSALDVPRPKPYPDPLLKILEYFRVEPDNVIYVGDSVVDEQAAKAAEIPLISYRNRSLSADYYIESLKEIEKILGIGELIGSHDTSSSE